MNNNGNNNNNTNTNDVDEIEKILQMEINSSDNEQQNNQQNDQSKREQVEKYFDSMTAQDKMRLLKKRKICGLVEGCDTIEGYQKLNRIHEGVYGEVFRARDMLTGEIVAIKKIKFSQHIDKEGFPITSIREFNLLLSLNHQNIVKVKRIVMGSDKVFMVMEYMEHELKDLIERSKYQFSTAEIKCLLRQLLLGIQHFHQKSVMHRDLKTSNLLYNNKGQLKVCDFGLGRRCQRNKQYTLKVVTLWYRAPELLLSIPKYNHKIDIWSAGCIFGELLLKDQLFKGQKEMEQLEHIFRILGTPTEETWPGLKNITLAGPLRTIPKYPGVKLQDIISKEFQLSEWGYDLLKKMLTLDPEKRIEASDALKHPWFSEQPLPLSEDLMPTFPPLNEVNRDDVRKKVKK
ncbi:unnamed protein product (macronuclear) [Paramecium tetraurelia]|uniref:Cyclin-dependent kinase 2 homolog n=2 Tax=Paramecium TaxID=5884 RepID=A0C2H8_PARTE|nr:uncharacterized protein GSPATT00034473001 [Paramecium tetraurelia]CAD8210325.1 unnamed protein product [Paramecium octaurelia]CAK64995.1 unnamed protein product [Paramecium tetraurelia]|eukprot:XP_001432392.1 hypothetical protein (macronuclear) [Paramecium tetraurelia strain d4-2]